MKRLSICIPTYNYGEFIGQTLASILPQVSAEVEVIILDGGSTDETTAVVNELQKDYPQLIYHYQNFRGGIDKDIEKVVSLAEGDYCWLFSADDIMLPDAIAKVLAAIKSNYDIYLCEHILCNLQMQPISEYPIFNNINSPRLFNLSDTLEKKEYFSSARTSEAFFSFLAGPIFKKVIWIDAKIPESFQSTCWIVAGHLLSMIPKGITIKYLNEVFIYKREGNDSFSNGSFVHRCEIGIENFHHIINLVFGMYSKEAFQIRRVLRRDVPLRSLLFAKMKAREYPDKENINKLIQLAKMHYADPTLSNWVSHLVFNISHPSAIKALYRFKLAVRNILK